MNDEEKEVYNNLTDAINENEEVLQYWRDEEGEEIFDTYVQQVWENENEVAVAGKI